MSVRQSASRCHLSMVTTRTRLLRTADIALYHAKRAGGESHRFFEARMAAELEEATELKHELRHALVAREIVPYFQRLLRMSDAAIVGFEALARWEHPTKGTLTPARFPPIVRASGLSGVLFERVLWQAGQAAKAWPQRLRLAVNIAPSELQNDELPHRVACVLEAAGFLAHRLEIGITETALIHDSTVPRSVLAGMRALAAGLPWTISAADTATCITCGSCNSTGSASPELSRSPSSRAVAESGIMQRRSSIWDMRSGWS